MLRETRQSLKGQQNLDDNLSIQNNLEQNIEESSSNFGDSNFEGSFQPNSSPLRQLNDNDYEFLFDQLLEGVAHGWHEGRIVKFFDRLKTRGKSEPWIEWLERFGTKVLTTSVPDRELAARMLLFGQTVQSSPSLKNFGLLAYQIGHQLISNNNDDPVWEYSEIEVVNDVPPVPADWQDVTPTEEAVWEDRETPLSNSPIQNNTSPKINSSIEEISQISADVPPSLSNVNFVESPQQTELNAVDQTSEISAEISSSSSIIPSFDSTNVEQNLNLSPAIGESAQDILADEMASTGNPPSSASLEIQSSESSSKAIVEENLGTEIPNLTPEQFLWILQQDANLIAQMSAQLNIDTKDPKLLIQTLIDRQNPNRKGDEEKNLELAESWFELGLKQANLDNMEEAIKSWDKAIAINPNLASAWHNRGSALGHLSKFTEAIASFDKALEIDPQDAQTWNDRAHALLKLKRWSEAIESWDKAIEIYPNFYQFWYNRGYALEKLGRSEESIASYEKALQIQPDVLSVNNRYSKLLENMTDLDR
jgi:tetratricopeptide (TPR) repeat protein